MKEFFRGRILPILTAVCIIAVTVAIAVTSVSAEDSSRLYNWQGYITTELLINARGSDRSNPLDNGDYLTLSETELYVGDSICTNNQWLNYNLNYTKEDGTAAAGTINGTQSWYCDGEKMFYSQLYYGRINGTSNNNAVKFTKAGTWTCTSSMSTGGTVTLITFEVSEAKYSCAEWLIPQTLKIGENFKDSFNGIIAKGSNLPYKADEDGNSSYFVSASLVNNESSEKISPANFFGYGTVPLAYGPDEVHSDGTGNLFVSSGDSTTYLYRPGSMSLKMNVCRNEDSYVVANAVEPYSITIEEPIITTNEQKTVAVGDSMSLNAELTNTMLSNTAVADYFMPENYYPSEYDSFENYRSYCQEIYEGNDDSDNYKDKFSDFESFFEYYIQMNWLLEQGLYGQIAYQPKIEIIEGADIVELSNEDYSSILNASADLKIKKDGTVKIKISYNQIKTWLDYDSIYSEPLYNPEKIITVTAKYNHGQEDPSVKYTPRTINMSAIGGDLEAYKTDKTKPSNLVNFDTDYITVDGAEFAAFCVGDEIVNTNAWRDFYFQFESDGILQPCTVDTVYLYCDDPSYYAPMNVGYGYTCGSTNAPIRFLQAGEYYMVAVAGGARYEIARFHVFWPTQDIVNQLSGETEQTEYNCDVNSDGVVDSRDLIVLQMRILGLLNN